MVRIFFCLLLAGCLPAARYKNDEATPFATGGANLFTAVWALFFDADPLSKPPSPPPIKALVPGEMPEALSLAWLGHASVLVRLEGKYILTDPLFAERMSPPPWVGPKRFHPLPLKPTAFPKISAVVISHDHQDHLDEEAIRLLAPITERFIVPLEVGYYLVKWGVAKEKIVELNWWQETSFQGIRYVCLPARHNSGRELIWNDATLWASWAIIGEKQRLYFAGDTGMFPGFKIIGEKFGPFGVTLMPIGASDPLWALVHLNPEEAVQAHLDVRGNKAFPIHWGTFDLARHRWNEPWERFHAEAKKRGVPTFEFIPGEIVVP